MNAAPPAWLTTSRDLTRLVIAAPPDAQMPAALEALLAVPDVNAVVVHDLLTAWVELCLAERGQTARTAWGLQRQGTLGLVIVDDGQWTDLDAMESARHRFLPDSQSWLCAASMSIDPMPIEPAPFDPSQSHDEAFEPLSQPEHRDGGLDDEYLDDEPAPRLAPIDDDPAAIVSREELSFLLRGDDPDDATEFPR